MKRKLSPILVGDWSLIGPSPDLYGVLPGADEWRRGWIENGRAAEHNAPVDHHIVQDINGGWHLWGCVRATAVGRILHHWRTNDFLASPWEQTGEIIRVNRAAGESAGNTTAIDINSAREECIQSPFFVRHGSLYHMFYGGGAAPGGSEQDGLGRRSQICLMTSPDGLAWTRHKGPGGRSSLFEGPGPARDPCVVPFEGGWLLYYAGTREDASGSPVFWVRTSTDLLTWSAPRVVHEDLGISAQRWGTECPFVTFRDGWFYLFRTVNYYAARTYVFRSGDPFDFGIGDARGKCAGMISAAAPELYTLPGGAGYVSSNHEPRTGTMRCRLEWVEQ
ncbi:hypothetical protein GX586_01355 [bacterium]|nr:hypothetical protein [bacterium]